MFTLTLAVSLTQDTYRVLADTWNTGNSLSFCGDTSINDNPNRNPTYPTDPIVTAG